MTEEKFKQMLQDKYVETKSVWSLPPVDSKYEKMIIGVMKEVYNQGLKDALKNAECENKGYGLVCYPAIIEETILRLLIP